MKGLYKIHTTFFLVLTTANLSIASVPSMEDSALTWIYSNIILLFASIIIVGAFITLFSLLNRLLRLQKYELMKEEMDKQALEASNQPSLFKRIYDKAWSLVPLEKESELDLGHSFDGIHELDNKLPPWWVYLFFITIIWGIAAIYYNHFREDSKGQVDIYYAEMKIAEEAKEAYLLKQANAVDESNVMYLTEASDLASGQSTFVNLCSTCHGAQGQGGVGPNMTDDYWIHGGSITEIFKTIKYGVPEKGMIAWNSQLSPSAMQKVSSYIKSIHGTNPPNPKEPQGLLYEEQVLTLNE